MGYIRTTREAVVAYLKADSALSTYLAKGMFYDFARTAKHPLKLTRSDCPAIVVGPARTPRRAVTNRSDDVTVTLLFTLVADSPDAGDAEDFFNIVEAALEAGAPSYGLSGAEAPYLSEIGPAGFEGLFERKDAAARGIMWRVEFELSLTLRRAVR